MGFLHLMKILDSEINLIRKNKKCMEEKMTVNETVIEKENKTKSVKKEYKPKLYKVVFLNDDVTRFDFVINVLIEIFGKNKIEAIQLTQQIHEEGSGIAGIYYKEIAEQKRNETLNLARSYGFPLQVILEEVD